MPTTSSFRMKTSAVPAARRTSVQVTDMLLPYKDDDEGEQLIDDLDRLFLPPTERRVAR